MYQTNIISNFLFKIFVDTEDTTITENFNLSNPDSLNPKNIKLFLDLVLNQTCSEKEIGLIAAFYLEKVSKKIKINNFNWKSLILVSILISGKMWDDISVINKDMYILCQKWTTLKIINNWELHFLILVNFNLNIDKDVYQNFLDKLSNYSEV